MSDSFLQKVSVKLKPHSFQNLDPNKIDKEYAICTVKMKYTGNTMNMQKMANMSQPAAVNAVFEANLPFSSPRAASITKPVAGFISKDLRPYSMVENQGLTIEPQYEIPSRIFR